MTALTGGGAYADVVLADAVTVFPLPAGVHLRTAAALPTVLPTAYALVHSVGRLLPGETVLVQGAAGGVGTVAGQSAKAAGAGAVYGVVSGAAKAAYAREQGYDEAFVGEFAEPVRAATGGRGAGLVLGPVGGETLRTGLAPLAVFGRLVSFGSANSAPAWSVGRPEPFPRGVSAGGFSILTPARTAPGELRSLSERAFAKAVDGTVSRPVTAESALEEAAEAHRLMGARTSTGKLLLRVGGAR